MFPFLYYRFEGKYYISLYIYICIKYNKNLALSCVGWRKHRSLYEIIIIITDKPYKYKQVM